MRQLKGTSETLNIMTQKQPLINRNRTFQTLGVLLILISLLLMTLIGVSFGFSGKKGIIELSAYAIILFCFCTGVIFLSNHKVVHYFEARPRLQHRMNFLQGPLITLFILLLLFSSLEIGIRLYQKLNPVERIYWYTVNPQRMDFTSLTENPVYQGADFATPSFFKEAVANNYSVHIDPTTDVLVPNEYHGEWFNVIDQKRATTDQPENFEKRVYLFGGSSIFNLAVPDSLTVASFLQRKLNTQSPQVYRVENMGVIGLTTAEQLRRLETLNLQEEDIVIFYDGYNEIVDNFDYENKNMMSFLTRFKTFESLVFPINPGLFTAHKLPNLDEIKHAYYDSLISSQETAEAAGAAFFHCLQPNLHMVSEPTAREQSLISALDFTFPGWSNGFKSGYPKLYQAHLSLIQNGIMSFDFRFILNHTNRKIDHEIFLDDVHVNHVGNEIIANQIYQAIFEENLQP